MVDEIDFNDPIEISNYLEDVLGSLKNKDPFDDDIDFIQISATVFILYEKITDQKLKLQVLDIFKKLNLIIEKIEENSRLEEISMIIDEVFQIVDIIKTSSNSSNS